MKKLFLAAALALLTITVAAQPRPKLIVGVAVDQMRWDYLYRYYDLYGEGGFKRLMNEGYNCENTMINYVPSVTAVGHTSIYTGSVPALHGISGNSFMVNGKWQYCTADTTVQGVGTKNKAGQESPRNLLATTIGDELKVATNFKSKVIGVSIKDRAAILPAGRSADGAYWVDNKIGRFVTSTYYMKQLPQWAEKYNNSIGKITYDEINYSVRGNEITTNMALAAIDGEQLGQRGTTDMICISYSITDKIGHKFGTHCQLIQDAFVDLDKRLASLMEHLDKTVGKGQYLLFLSADHGAANNINMLRNHGIAAGGFFGDAEIKQINAHLKQKFQMAASPVREIYAQRYFLDHEAIEKAGAKVDDVKKAIIDYYLKQDCVAYAVDLSKATTTDIPEPIRQKIINGYNRLRGGDIQLILQPAWYETYGGVIDDGTTHAAWNPYDAHIPFLLMGWGVKHGSTNAPTHITDIAATVCAIAHLQMPNACIGNAIDMK